MAIILEDITETMEEAAETQAILIDEEFKHLMPPLGKEERAQLEASILESGCRDAVILWEGILIDGHNRYEICTRHGIPFNTLSMEFSSREEVLLWIIKNQMARRNLTPMQLVHFRGLHYRTEKKILTSKGWINQDSAICAQNEHIPMGQTTGSQLGVKYNVSQATIRRDAKASEGIDALGEVSSAAKEKVLLHEVKLAKNKLAGLASAPKEEVERLAKEIEEGTYNTKTDAGGQSDADGNASSEGTEAPGGSTSGDKTAAARPVDLLVDGLTGKQYQAALRAAERGRAAQAKKPLRALIDLLEELYAGL